MIIQELGLIGEVTLVRFVGETMWVTFRDGQSALTAVAKKSVRISGIDFHFNLKTENWLAQVEREIALCTTNTVQLCTASPTAGTGDYNSLGIPKKPPSRPKSPPCRPMPPTRPPLPTTPKHTPKAGVISVIPAAVTHNQPAPAPSPVPQRPAPAVPDNPSPPISSRSSDSSGASPQHEPQQNSPIPIQSMHIQPQDTGAIYEEINDDVVSETHLCLPSSHPHCHESTTNRTSRPYRFSSTFRSRVIRLPRCRHPHNQSHLARARVMSHDRHRRRHLQRRDRQWEHRHHCHDAKWPIYQRYRQGQAHRHHCPQGQTPSERWQYGNLEIELQDT